MPAHAADNDALMKNAMSAAPEGVAKNATIMISDGKGGMITLKKGRMALHVCRTIHYAH
jgi:hypothetical protein